MSLDISVIITVHNEPLEQLSRAVLSAKACDVKEILVINDGSSEENTLNYTQFCKSQKIEIKNIYPNKGVSNARNTGIKKASGKYITFLDSDDELSKDWINSFIDIERLDPDLILFPIYMRSKNENICFRAKIITPNVLIQNINYSCLFDEGFLILNDKHLFKRNFLLKNNIIFDINRFRGEDSVFMADCLSKELSVAYCGEFLQIYNNQKELRLSKEYIINELDSLYYCYKKFEKKEHGKIYAGFIMETIKARKTCVLSLSKYEIKEINSFVKKLKITNLSFKNKFILFFIKLFGIKFYFLLRNIS